MFGDSLDERSREKEAEVTVELLAKETVFAKMRNYGGRGIWEGRAEFVYGFVDYEVCIS